MTNQEKINKLEKEVKEKSRKLEELKNNYVRVELRNGNEFYYEGKKVKYSILGMGVGILNEEEEIREIKFQNIPKNNLSANAYYLYHNLGEYFGEMKSTGRWIKTYVFPILYLKIDVKGE